MSGRCDRERILAHGEPVGKSTAVTKVGYFVGRPMVIPASWPRGVPVPVGRLGMFDTLFLTGDPKSPLVAFPSLNEIPFPGSVASLSKNHDCRRPACGLDGESNHGPLRNNISTNRDSPGPA